MSTTHDSHHIHHVVHDLTHGKPYDEDVLAKKERPFWVLVKGCAHAPDYLLAEQDVLIEDAGIFS